MNRRNETTYRIVRRAGQQGMRLPVVSHAGIDKYATGSDSLSPSSITSGDKNLTDSGKENSKMKLAINSKDFENNNERTYINGIRVATINVRTVQDDFKLATVIKETSKLGIDILALQEVRRVGFGYAIFDDDSIKGWRFIWNGYK